MGNVNSFSRDVNSFSRDVNSFREFQWGMQFQWGV